MQAHGGLSFTLFSVLLLNHFPGLSDEANLDSERPWRVFQALDLDRDGFLNFYEFCRAMHIFLRGSPKERLGLMFDVQDHNGALRLFPCVLLVTRAFGCGLVFDVRCD